MSEAYKSFIASLIVAGVILGLSIGGLFLYDYLQNPQQELEQNCETR